MNWQTISTIHGPILGVYRMAHEKRYTNKPLSPQSERKRTVETDETFKELFQMDES